MRFGENFFENRLVFLEGERSFQGESPRDGELIGASLELIDDGIEERTDIESSLAYSLQEKGDMSSNEYRDNILESIEDGYMLSADDVLLLSQEDPQLFEELSVKQQRLLIQMRPILSDLEAIPNHSSYDYLRGLEELSSIRDQLPFSCPELLEMPNIDYELEKINLKRDLIEMMEHFNPVNLLTIVGDVPFVDQLVDALKDRSNDFAMGVIESVETDIEKMRNLVNQIPENGLGVVYDAVVQTIRMLYDGGLRTIADISSKAFNSFLDRSEKFSGANLAYDFGTLTGKALGMLIPSTYIRMGLTGLKGVSTLSMQITQFEKLINGGGVQKLFYEKLSEKFPNISEAGVVALKEGFVSSLIGKFREDPENVIEIINLLSERKFDEFMNDERFEEILLDAVSYRANYIDEILSSLVAKNSGSINILLYTQPGVSSELRQEGMGKKVVKEMLSHLYNHEKLYLVRRLLKVAKKEMTMGEFLSDPAVEQIQMKLFLKSKYLEGEVMARRFFSQRSNREYSSFFPSLKIKTLIEVHVRLGEEAPEDFFETLLLVRAAGIDIKDFVFKPKVLKYWTLIYDLLSLNERFKIDSTFASLILKVEGVPIEFVNSDLFSNLEGRNRLRFIERFWANLKRIFASNPRGSFELFLFMQNPSSEIIKRNMDYSFAVEETVQQFEAEEFELQRRRRAPEARGRGEGSVEEGGGSYDSFAESSLERENRLRPSDFEEVKERSNSIEDSADQDNLLDGLDLIRNQYNFENGGEPVG